MKLNPDCIRDLMTYLEDELKMTVYGYIPLSRVKIFEHFYGKYDYADVLYSLIQLHKSGYIYTDYSFNEQEPKVNVTLDRVFYIEPKGHELIASIKDAETWKNKISPVIKILGSVSLSIIETVARGATEGVLSRISLPQSDAL